MTGDQPVDSFVDQSRVGSDGTILWVTIRRPPVNALNAEVRRGLVSAAKTANEPGVAAVVLAGHGEVFSAGGDIEELNALASDQSPVEAASVHDEYLDLYESWDRIPVPTIAAVRGYALGGALELMLNCDLRFADPKAVFAASGVKMGLIESAHSLPGVVGATRAAEMLLVAAKLSANDALKSGLINTIATDPVGVALEAAERISRHPTSAVRATKEVLKLVRDEGRSAGAELAVRRWRQLQSGPDHREIVGEWKARKEDAPS